MKRFAFAVAAVSLFVTGGLAEQPTKVHGSEAGGMGKMGSMRMMGKDSAEMCHSGMERMGCAPEMIEFMTIRNVVATSDGGVVVVSGNKLMKYDANLILKKEVEVKMDTLAMRHYMNIMMSKCTMMCPDTSGMKPKK